MYFILIIGIKFVMARVRVIVKVDISKKKASVNLGVDRLIFVYLFTKF